jgi:ParB/RepB/Spo0J family partition protein
MQEIELHRITPSPTNPRKTFDDGKLVDLSESIKSKGVLQPILVRLTAMGDFELVAGERRFRAAKLAGLKTIPVTVRDLTDIEVIEIQVIENDQREDVLPTERARGYQSLLDAGQSIDTIAAKVGKSESWVRGVLRAIKLPQDAAEALDGGELSQKVATLISRVPGVASREKVALCVLRGAHDPAQIPKAGQNEPLSYSEAKELIGRHFTRELKGAPFDTKDTTLPPGPCTTCDKRAGNAGDEYADIRADMCLDTKCFAEKVKLSVTRQTHDARAEGFTVLTKKQTEEIFRWGSFNSDEHVRLDYPLPWEVENQMNTAGAKKISTLRAAIVDRLDLLEQFLAFSPAGDRIEMIRIADMKREINALFPKPKKEAIDKADQPVTEWEIYTRARKEYAEEIAEEIDATVEEKDLEKAQGLVIKMLAQLMLRELPKDRPLISSLPKQILDLFPLTSKVTPQLYPNSDNKDAEVLRSLGPAAMLAPLAAWAAYQFEEDVDRVQEFGYLADGTFSSLKKSVEAAIKKERAELKKAKGKAKAGAK